VQHAALSLGQIFFRRPTLVAPTSAGIEDA
jgi:hypothetical protein